MRILKNQLKKIATPTLYSIIAASGVQPIQSSIIPISIDHYHLLLYAIVSSFFVKKEMGNEESPLEVIFRNRAYVKIVDTLVTHPDCEYTLSELSESADVAPSWVALEKEALLHYRIIKPTSIVDSEQRYQFNKESSVGMLLNDLSFKLATIDIEQEQ